MPFVLALLAFGGIGTVTYFATRKPGAPAMMLPGQTWQVFGYVEAMSPWDDTAKTNVKDAIVTALQKSGAIVIEGNWTPDSPVLINEVSHPTFFMAIQPSKPMPVWSTPEHVSIELPKWSSYFVVTALAQAPANIPAPLPTIGTSYNAFS